MRNIRLAAPLAGLLLVTACTSKEVDAFETGASAFLADVQAAAPLIAAISGVPGWFMADITLADNGLSGILAASEITNGTVKADTLSGAATAVADIKAQLPNNADVQKAVVAADAALTALSATQTSSAKVQAFAALGAVALAVEQAEQGASAGRYSAASPAQNLINDAGNHLHDLNGAGA